MAYRPPAANAIAFVLYPRRYTPPPADAIAFVRRPAGGEVYHPPVPGVVASFGTPWRRGNALMLQRATRTQRPREVEPVVALAYQAGTPTEAANRSAWRPATMADDAPIAAPWSPVAPLARDTTIAYDAVIPRDESQAVGWDDSIAPRDHATAAPYLQAPAKDAERASPHEQALHWRQDVWQPGYNPTGLRRDGLALVVRAERYAPTLPLQVVFRRRRGRWLREPTARDTGLQAVFRQATTRNLERHHVPWSPAGYRDTSIGIRYPDYPGPIDPNDPLPPTPPTIREVYQFVNVVNIVRLPDRTPIDMINVRLAHDADAWAWTLTAEVIGDASLDMIRPSRTSNTSIEVDINGWVWVFMVERYGGSRGLANNRYTVHGVSRTQLLAAPYAPLRSRLVASELTARQIAEDELLGTGFDLVWPITPEDRATPDWVVPAGAFGYQDLAPLQAIKRLTDAAGALLLPSRDEDTLRVQPRFAVSPWALDEAVVGAVVPMAMVTDLSSQWQPRPLYNSVVVSGINVGVLGTITRAGTAGDQPAPDVFDELLVDEAVNTERGRQILADSGNQELVELTLPIPEIAMAPGLVESGMMIEVVEGSSAWRGYVLSIAVDAPGSGVARVSQRISVVRFHDHG